MAYADAAGRTLEQFALLLDYPTSALPAQTGRCAELVSALCPAAPPKLTALRDYADRESVAVLEELYTRTFELHAKCYPYLGFHLFGDSQQRALFLARLNELYRERGFAAGAELADHLVVVLRFLAQSPADEETAILLTEGLAPAVNKMASAFNGDTNPYGEVIGALDLLMTELTTDT